MVLISWIEEVYWSSFVIYILTLVISISVMRDYKDGFKENGKYVDNLHRSLYYMFSVMYGLMLLMLGYLMYAIHHLFSIEGIL